jgi:phosphoribosyl 1,2-cyclic phosphodiesterase
MKLQVINSNSQGNSYILENDNETLLIECGVRFDKIKKALGFNLNKVVGCLLTHEHGDHCFAAKDIVKSCIRLYASMGTHQSIGTDGHRYCVVVNTEESYSIGSFKVKAFDVKHDAAQPLGFLIWHPETGLILFLTDSYYSEYKFNGLNNIIIEANYCQGIMDERVKAGEDPKFLRDRTITSHMSLSTCKELLQANDLSAVNNIVLIHLSDRNSDAARFQKEVEEVTGKQVHIAKAGLTIENFGKKPF